MIDLHDGQITDLLNNSMRYNPETISIGYAILQEKQRLLALLARTRLMALIDSADEKTLDYLAVELRTPAYKDTFPVDVKRRLIAGTLPFYARLGTPAAVNWIIRSIFGEGHMEDWFRYDGDPHHFRAFVGNDGDTITPEALDEFRRAVASVKRLSSWMDAIISSATMEAATVYMTPVFNETYSKTVLPDLEPDFPGSSFGLAPFMGQGRTITCVPVVPDPDVPELQAVPQFAGHAGSCMRTVLPVLEDHNSQLSGTSDAQVNDHTNNRTRPASNLKEETT